MRKGETICAPATSTGGALTIIRISGPESLKICDKIFRPMAGKLKLSEQEGYKVVYGEIFDREQLIDDVLVTVFRKPHSYTGENSAEISCHGSPYISRKILELLIRNGAVSARPGEFTMRAFMNSKMDLSQAEAVADLVASSSEASHRLAIHQMRGGFSEEIKNLRKELLHFASLIELELDFGEEDVEFADRNELLAIVRRVKELSQRLASSFSLGNAIKNGIPVVIAGKPNSGKSTLLNALLMEERAIVSEVPGTTRDFIEDTLIIGGVEYRFIDTAGLRETSDAVEILGIKKTHEKINQARVILLVDEVTNTPEIINRRADYLRNLIDKTDKRLIILINKIDLHTGDFREKMISNIKLRKNESLLFISAKEKTGLDELRAKLGEVVEKNRLSSEDIIITNVRHYEALINVSDSLGRVEEGLQTGIPEDLIAMDIRQAIHYLGEITGEITSDEILGNIFKNFCIGK
ncbi:MAG: tRNA uridine-5-carboxymethylaminomethyl(34) synthesis GTPase MnmE [Bacteroidales bacterium]